MGLATVSLQHLHCRMSRKLRWLLLLIILDKRDGSSCLVTVRSWGSAVHQNTCNLTTYGNSLYLGLVICDTSVPSGLVSRAVGKAPKLHVADMTCGLSSPMDDPKPTRNRDVPGFAPMHVRRDAQMLL